MNALLPAVDSLYLVNWVEKIIFAEQLKKT
jgi:hypothetical protein